MIRKVELRRKGEEWVVRAREQDGAGREYAFNSKNQARFFAAVLRMGPRELPEQGRPIEARGERSEERF